MKIEYPANIVQGEDGRYVVQFVDFEEAFTEGESLEEVQFNASEVLSAIIAFRVDHGQEIPMPTLEIIDAHYIPPDAKTQAALLFRAAKTGTRLSDLARALETSWPAAKRLEDPHHWPSLRQLERAAAALGKRLVLCFE